MDYYDILGIDKDATPETVRQTYKKLAIQYHPDRNPDNTTAQDRMAEINEAYAVLSNPEKRREYDGLRSSFGNDAAGHFRSRNTHQDLFDASDIERVFQEIADGFGIRGFNELFSSGSFKGGGFFVFGTFGNLGKGKGKGKNPIPALTAMGAPLLKHFFTRMIRTETSGLNRHETLPLSPKHARDGGPFAYLLQPDNKKLVIQIPPRVSEGKQIRLKGMGKTDPVTGDTGDLYLTIAIKNNLLNRIKKRLIK